MLFTFERPSNITRELSVPVIFYIERKLFIKSKLMTNFSQFLRLQHISKIIFVKRGHFSFWINQLTLSRKRTRSKSTNGLIFLCFWVHCCLVWWHQNSAHLIRKTWSKNLASGLTSSRLQVTAPSPARSSSQRSWQALRDPK